MTQILVPEIGIRPGFAEDVPFIFRRTLIDLRFSDFARGMTDKVFYTYMHRALEQYLPRAIVRVAYPDAQRKGHAVESADTRHILGFIIAEKTTIGLVVHYAHVRQDVHPMDRKRLIRDYRRQGIATKLLRAVQRDTQLEGKQVTYTYRTAMFRGERNEAFARRIDSDPLFEYNGFLFFTLLPPGWETGRLPILNEDYKREINKTGHYESQYLSPS
jgi:GNAT superfamily N-acetyltransferase